MPKERGFAGMIQDSRNHIDQITIVAILWQAKIDQNLTCNPVELSGVPHANALAAEENDELSKALVSMLDWNSSVEILDEICYVSVGVLLENWIRCYYLARLLQHQSIHVNPRGISTVEANFRENREEQPAAARKKEVV